MEERENVPEVRGGEGPRVVVRGDAPAVQLDQKGHVEGSDDHLPADAEVDGVVDASHRGAVRAGRAEGVGRIRSLVGLGN